MYQCMFIWKIEKKTNSLIPMYKSLLWKKIQYVKIFLRMIKLDKL